MPEALRLAMEGRQPDRRRGSPGAFRRQLEVFSGITIFLTSARRMRHLYAGRA
jgi:hypothetical protein